MTSEHDANLSLVPLDEDDSWRQPSRHAHRFTCGDNEPPSALSFAIAAALAFLAALAVTFLTAVP